MVYDALAESVRLLSGVPFASNARVTRRVRHVPLALDQDEDVAVTMFLRRGVNGIPELDVHTLELTDKGWRLLGGSSGPADRALGARPLLAASGSPGESHGGGGTARMSSRRLGWSQDNWVRWAELRLAQEVAGLRIGGRELPVAAHGIAVVVWRKQPPAVLAVDSTGVVLGAVPLGRHSVPERYRN